MERRGRHEVPTPAEGCLTVNNCQRRVIVFQVCGVSPAPGDGPMLHTGSPHKLIGSGTIRRCGIVGVSVAFVGGSVSQGCEP